MCCGYESGCCDQEGTRFDRRQDAELWRATLEPQGVQSFSISAGQLPGVDRFQGSKTPNKRLEQAPTQPTHATFDDKRFRVNHAVTRLLPARLLAIGFIIFALLSSHEVHALPKMDSEALVKILRVYDPSFDAAAVRASLAGPNSADLVRWATLHLTPDTLLTPDELSQSVNSRSLVTMLILIRANQIRRPRGMWSGRPARRLVRPCRSSCPG